MVYQSASKHPKNVTRKFTVRVTQNALNDVFFHTVHRALWKMYVLDALNAAFCITVYD